MKKYILSIIVSDKMKKAILEYAEDNETTISAIVRDAIKKYLKL